MSGDGCSSTCTIEPGYTCTGQPSHCVTSCGDGKRAGAELCDDGSNDGVGCAFGCAGWATGYSCAGGTPTTPDVCVVCGAACPTPPWIPIPAATTTTSSGSSSTTTASTSVCGNGIVEAGE